VQLKLAVRACIYWQGARRGVSLGRGHPFIHGSLAKRFAGGRVAESP
jgi:hypothetical protein